MTYTLNELVEDQGIESTMKTHTLTVNHQPVAVYDSATTAPPVVFVHGNSHHSGSFTALIQALPESSFRTILIDLPGHGASSAATDSQLAYSIPWYADTLIEITETLAVPDAVFVGHSLGGHVILEALPTLERARGALLMGAPPVSSPADLGDAFLPNPSAQAFFKDSMSAEDAAGIRAALHPASADFTTEVLTAYGHTDPAARTRLAESIATGDFRDEKAVIADASVPVALLAGEDDHLINPAYYDTLPPRNLWLGAAQRLTGCGHWAHALPNQQITKHLGRYLRDCVEYA